MNTAREIVQEIIDSGGELWFDGDHVRGHNIPRRLAILIKADEGAMLAALLTIAQSGKRLAIQEESPEQPAPASVAPEPSKAPESAPIPDAPPRNLLKEAETLLGVLRKIGVIARLDNGKLVLTPESLIWDSDRAYIAELTPQLISLLKAEQPRGPCGSCKWFELSGIMGPDLSECTSTENRPIVRGRRINPLTVSATNTLDCDQYKPLEEQ